MDAFPEPPGVDIEHDPMEFADREGSDDFDEEVLRVYRWLLCASNVDAALASAAER